LITHQFHPTILRAYDIRGIVGETLHDQDAYMIGLGFADRLRAAQGRHVVIGRDGRLSSPHLAAALAEGLVDGGMMVTDIGVGPTPKLYFADQHFNADGAIQVTGSHNPPSHNGFKMVLGHKPFFSDDITQLGVQVAAGVDQQPGGQCQEHDLQADYIAAMLDAIGLNAIGSLDGLDDKTFIWDCGNGAAGPSAMDLTKAISGQHHVLFAEIDGNFPNHHPDPVNPETLDLLREAVAKHNAEMGIGFDGDGDRIGLIDAKGRQVPGDLLTAYLSRHSLRKTPGAQVIFDVKSSLAALDAVTGLGGAPLLWKTGHSHMKTKMKETGAPIGGEMSGHLFLADGYYGYDDALFAALAVLREMAVSGESITAFVDSLPETFATPELRIPCDDTIKFDVMARVIADVSAHPDADQQDAADMDGIRVTGDQGWWLIRASNTGAELVARAEGRDEAACAMLKERIRSRLKTAGLNWEG